MTLRPILRYGLLAGISLNAIHCMAAPYEIADLGDLGGQGSYAYDLNASGIAVGSGTGPLIINTGGVTAAEFANHGALFNGGAPVDLGSLDAGNALALGINDGGTIVGFGYEIIDGDQFSRGLIFSSGSDPQVMPEPANSTALRALDVNNSDLIVGYATIDFDSTDSISPQERGFVFDNASKTFVGMLPPFVNENDRKSVIEAINDTGMVAGWAHTEDSSGNPKAHGFFASVSDLDNPTDIGHLGGDISVVNGMNNGGVLVGRSANSSSQLEAFVYDPGTSPALQGLGFLDPRFTYSEAFDVNDMGQIVGLAANGSSTRSEYTAFLYENGEMKDLNLMIDCDKGWELESARAINNAGQIVGYGTIGNKVHAYLLTPTPGGGDANTNCAPADPGPGGGSSGGGGSIPASILALLALAGFRRKPAMR